MSAPLPPFSGLGSCCPKCGSRGLAARYVSGTRDVQYGSVAWKADPELFPCLQRRCGVCHFETLEAPLSTSDALTTPLPEQTAFRRGPLEANEDDTDDSTTRHGFT